MNIRKEHAINRNEYIESLAEKVLPDNILDIVKTFTQQPEFKNPSYSISYDNSTEFKRNWYDINKYVERECYHKLKVHCEFKRIPGDDNLGYHNLERSTPDRYEFKVSLYN